MFAFQAQIVECLALSRSVLCARVTKKKKRGRVLFSFSLHKVCRQSSYLVRLLHVYMHFMREVCLNKSNLLYTFSLHPFFDPEITFWIAKCLGNLKSGTSVSSSDN